MMKTSHKRLFAVRHSSKVAHPPFSLPPRSSLSAAREGGVTVPPITRIAQLPVLMGPSSSTLFPLFDNIFVAEAKPAALRVPVAFEEKVRKMFAAYPGGTTNLKFIENQTIVTTYNKYTEEYSLFNEVRRYRPGYLERISADQEQQINAMGRANEGPATCDFCSMERTAEDVFGRITSRHCYTAANIAKYESWHSLLVSKVHDTLAITTAELVDHIQTAHKWFDAVHQLDPEAVFPHLMWDAGARASASQPHKHMQISLTHDRYFTRAESTRRAALAYEEQFEGRNYWRDVLAVHETLGLAVRHGEAMLISHLCPIKERELIIVAETSRTNAFAELLSVALQAMKDDVGTRAFSLAITFHPLAVPPAPPAGGVGRDGSRSSGSQRSFFSRGGEYDAELEARLIKNYPTIARIVDRGSPLDKRSDVGAMEFFGANNVGADPFEIMTHLRRRITELHQRG